MSSRIPLEWPADSDDSSDDPSSCDSEEECGCGPRCHSAEIMMEGEAVAPQRVDDAESPEDPTVVEEFCPNASSGGFVSEHPEKCN